METKQVIVIRKDLKMRRGKEIAQGSHASMKVFFDRIQEYDEEIYVDDVAGYDGIRTSWQCDFTPEMEAWKKGIFTKVVCKVDSEEELLDLVRKAKEANIPVALIEDCGKTEFHGIPTKTCCAIGPDNVDKINEITGHLQLY